MSEMEQDAEYQQLLDVERERLSGRSSSALASKVMALGGVMVGFAYVVGGIGVLIGAASMLGAVVWSDTARSGAAVASGVLVGAAVIALSLVQAAVIALAGRYAQMRAATVLETH